jgi:hypothetical protein
VLATVAVHSYFYPRAHTVFDIYAHASTTWWRGGEVYARTRDYFRYSPLFAIALTPIAELPERYGNVVWKLLNGCGYAVGVLAWAQVVVPTRLGRSGVAVLSLLALPNALHSLHNGQANLLMIGCLLGALAAAAGERWNRAACLLAAATLIKGYPLALALLLAAVWWRRFAMPYLGALAAGLLLPFATKPTAFVLAQYSCLANHLFASEHLMRERLRSIDYLLQVSGCPVNPSQFALMGLMAGLVALAATLAYARKQSDRRAVLAYIYMVFAAWVVLFGPATESCTYAVLGPALAWGLVETYRSGRIWGGRVALTASLFLTALVGTDLFVGAVRDFSNEHGGQPVGGILFVAFVAAETWRGVVTGNRPSVSPLWESNTLRNSNAATRGVAAATPVT